MEKKKLHRKKYRNVIDRLAEPYLDSCQPKCAYFGRCGGCLFQNIDYEKQLLIKADYLRDLLGSTVNGDLLSQLTVQGSTPFGYRNRMDFVAAFGKRGLRERGRFKQVVDIEHCEIMNDKLNRAWKTIREKSLSVEDYDYLVHKGFLRYTVLRSAHFTGEIMATFVISRESPEINPLIETAKELFDSVSVVIHDGFADLSTGEVAYNPKRGYIEEAFGDIRYRITSNSFFQSNSECAVRMYQKIAESVYGNVLDLFSGVGSISLFAAKKADHVTGVEIIESAVSAARVNAENNSITNAEFVCADALPYMKENTGKFDTLVLDPPRTGAHPKVLKAVQQCSPERIVYMSCNPVTFKDNMALLSDYKIVSFEAYDMFPQTPHLETLAVLEKR